MEKSKIFDIVKSGQNLVLLEQLLQGIMKDQFKGFSPNDFFEKEYGIIPKRESKEYDIDNNVFVGVLMLGGMPLELAETTVLGVQNIKIDSASNSGLSSMYTGYIIHSLQGILESFNSNIMEVGFKYLSAPSSLINRKGGLERHNKRLFKHLGLSLVESYECRNGGLKDIYVNKDKTVFFDFTHGYACCSDYCSMYAFDIKEGFKTLDKILEGKTNISYVKDIEIFHNGLANCNVELIKSIKGR